MQILKLNQPHAMASHAQAILYQYACYMGILKPHVDDGALQPNWKCLSAAKICQWKNKLAVSLTMSTACVGLDSCYGLSVAETLRMACAHVTTLPLMLGNVYWDFLACLICCRHPGRCCGFLPVVAKVMLSVCHRAGHAQVDICAEPCACFT